MCAWYGHYKKKKKERKEQKWSFLFHGFCTRDETQLFIFTGHSISRAFFIPFFLFGRETAFSRPFVSFLALLYCISCSACFALGVLFLHSLCILNIFVFFCFGGRWPGRLLKHFASLFLVSSLLIGWPLWLTWASLRLYISKVRFLEKARARHTKEWVILRATVPVSRISDARFVPNCCFWIMGWIRKLMYPESEIGWNKPGV